METKKCYKCGHVKLANEFHKDKTRLGGLQAKCKGCRKWMQIDTLKFSTKPKNYKKSTIVHREGRLIIRCTSIRGRISVYRIMLDRKLLFVCYSEVEYMAFCSGAKHLAFLPDSLMEAVAYACLATGRQREEVLKIFVSRGISRLEKENYQLL